MARGSGRVGTNHIVLLVREVDASTAEALGYIRSLRSRSLHVITPGLTLAPALGEAWATFAGPSVPAPTPIGAGSLTGDVRRYILEMDLAPADVVTLVVPEMVGDHLTSHVVRTKDLVRLKAALLRIPHVVVTDVPVVTTHEGPRGVDAKPLIPYRTVALVFLSGVNDLTIRAVNYAKTLDASITRAIYFDLDPEAAHRLEAEWFDAGLEIPLDIVEAPFRDLTGPMLEEVRRFSTDAGTVVERDRARGDRVALVAAAAAQPERAVHQAAVPVRRPGRAHERAHAREGHPEERERTRPSERASIAAMNIRPATKDDLAFLRKMLYEAARWNPDWPREPMEEVLAEPMLLRYYQDWGRPGDGGVLAETEGEPVGAAWYRLFSDNEPGYGYVDEKTPELSIAVVPLHRRKGIGEAVLRSRMVQAREEGFQSLSLSVASHNRSRMMYQRAGVRARLGIGRPLDHGREPLRGRGRLLVGPLPSLASLAQSRWSAEDPTASAPMGDASALRRLRIHQIAPATSARAAKIETGTKYCSRVCHWEPRAFPA